jgi:hypothetical protein
MTDDLTPRWQLAHPEFPAADMPADLPAAWIDASENGDACPRFDAGYGITIWIDWANPAHRDVAGASRFTVTLDEAGNVAITGDAFEPIRIWAEALVSIAVDAAILLAQQEVETSYARFMSRAWIGRELTPEATALCVAENALCDAQRVRDYRPGGSQEMWAGADSAD